MSIACVVQEYRDFTPEEEERVFTLLKADLDALLDGQLTTVDGDDKIQFNPAIGPRATTETDTGWTAELHPCSTCLIGAHLIRHGNRNLNDESPSSAFAHQHNLPYVAVTMLYYGAALTSLSHYRASEAPRALHVVVRCLRHAQSRGWRTASAEDEIVLTQLEEFVARKLQ